MNNKQKLLLKEVETLVRIANRSSSGRWAREQREVCIAIGERLNDFITKASNGNSK